MVVTSLKYPSYSSMLKESLRKPSTFAWAIPVRVPFSYEIFRMDV